MAQDQTHKQNVYKTQSEPQQVFYNKNGNGVLEENDDDDNNDHLKDLLDIFNEFDEPRIIKSSNNDLKNLNNSKLDLHNNTQRQLQSTDNLDLDFNQDIWTPSGRTPTRKNSTSSLKSIFQPQNIGPGKYDIDPALTASSSIANSQHNKTFLHKLRNPQRTNSFSSTSSKFMFGRSRSQCGSQNILTSPIDVSRKHSYGTGNSNKYAYLEQDDILTSSSFTSSISSTSHYNNNFPSNKDCGNSRKGGPRKWFSFSNLWSHRQNLTNILAMPKSRLSVTSLFTPGTNNNGVSNESSGSSSDVTPTEGKNYKFCSKELCSPTPSCVTISGEFPSTNNSIVFPLSSISNNAGGVIFRNESGRKSTPQRSVSATTPETSSGSSRPYLKKDGGANRFSCGELFPSGGVPPSPGYLGPDFQFHFYSSNVKNKTIGCAINDKGDNYYNINDAGDSNFHGIAGELGYLTSPSLARSSATLESVKEYQGRSLPTLLEAMECATSGATGAISSQTNSGDKTESLTVASVAELLYEEFAIFTGAKTIDDHYILIFPDRGNFHTLGESDYRRLMTYLASVPTRMQDAESGFVIIIDRRNDKWNSVKSAVLRVSTYFPATIHRVFVLRPVGFLQKALSEVSSKLFRIENLRFRLTVCNNVTDLSTFIDATQLPSELNGLLLYEKVKWVQERVEIESFQLALQTLSKCLKRFTESFHDIEYPNDVNSTEKFIRNKEEEFGRLGKDLSEACKHGEAILTRLKTPGTAGVSRIDLNNQQRDSNSTLSNRRSGTQLVNVVSIERLILQIDETQNLFMDFWNKEKTSLENYLELRRFEQDFRELQASFDTNLKCLSGIPEMGDDLTLTESLITDTLNFQELTTSDLQKATELELVGRNIVALNPNATDIVEPKCIELARVTSNFAYLLQDKITKQRQWREVQQSIEKANLTCTEGMDLVTSQQMLEETPNWSTMTTEIDSFLLCLEAQLESLISFKTKISNCESDVAVQGKVLIKQVIKRLEEVQGMCLKRHAFVSHQREKEISLREGVRSRSNSGSSWNSMELNSHKTALHQQSSSETGFGDSLDGSCFSSLSSSTNSYDNNVGHAKFLKETCDIKRGHILHELLQTEKSYAEEIGSVLEGYRDIALNPDINYLGIELPSQLVQEDKQPCANKISTIFCNLDEICSFHSKLFLPDLQNCIQSIELVGLCFIQRHSDFLAIYSEYCQLMPSSEALLKEIGKTHPWFLKCQEKLGQQLPLSSYLLKPVQRITKYHLLLRDLVKNSEHCLGYSEVVEALECMLVVLKSVNDGMHQLAIRGYPSKLPDQGSLLLQGSFTVWMDTSKSRIRLKGHQRYLFLYEKSILMCKKIGAGSTVTYEFRNKINMSEIGMTEALKGSGSSKKFEIWIQGREQVFVLQAETQELKELWVKEIKNLLLKQLESLRVRFDLKSPMIICG